MMKVSGNFYIKCDNYGYVTLVEADSLDYGTSVYERPIGKEIEYDCCTEVCCEGYHSRIDAIKERGCHLAQL